jgi:uncharacterized membrane protein YgcG
LLNGCLLFTYFAAMAEFAQLKVELAKAVEDRTGTRSEQKDTALRESQLVCIFCDFSV